MNNEFKSLQGMSDISGFEVNRWQEIETLAREVFLNNGYNELRTPILERSNLFLHSLGGSSDIVQKEMYSLKDRGGRDLVLRPEGTAGAVRYLASLGQAGLNERIYYLGPMFRCERPQAGRKRQFHQVGVENPSEPNPFVDAECIALQCELLKKWGISDFSIRINTLGSEEDKNNVRDRLLKELEKFSDILSPEQQNRINMNVLRFLDSKDDNLKAIIDKLPDINEFMSVESRQYLQSVIRILQELGISVIHDQRLVRGLDYYKHTVWEITHNSLGSQNSLSGGGRYSIQSGRKEVNGVGFAMGIERIITAKYGDDIDYYKHTVWEITHNSLGSQNSLAGGGRYSIHSGKKEVNGVGFAMGIERIITAKYGDDINHIKREKDGFWIVSLGEKSILENMKLAKKIRAIGIRCGMELESKSMKAQLRK
ncbi:MAG: histidine--tRNA ligase, partial [Kiritimatiellaceae bacterium]|nr:histidine--tRNA ligase [Kiritimatiellaceae bacterium]